MSSPLITELDSSFGNSQVDVSYPYIHVQTSNVAALPLIIGLLEDGNLPIYFTQEGETYELARVACDPINLLKLLRVYHFKFVKSAESSINVVDNVSLMEACR